MSAPVHHDLLDVESVRALARRLVSDELIVFPVRHHSPACSLHLQRLIAAKKPSVVLVEGPRAFSPLIAALTHDDTVAPVALYTYAVWKQKAGDDEEAEQRLAAYYPFCDYSPELVALREAKRLGIPARFIDLDFTEQAQFDAEQEEEAANAEEAASLLDERHFRRSRHLQLLAERLGCRDHEELWEHLFEAAAPSLPLEEHIAQMTAYCAAARQDGDDKTYAADGTLRREAEMAWHIQQALTQRQAGDGPVLAVMGGFHAVVMPQLMALPATRPAFKTGRVSDTHCALIRYSFERLDRLNGYSAGMTSPAWHQRLWDLTARRERHGGVGFAGVREEAALAVLHEVADEVRSKLGQSLPVPTLAASYEQTLRLAMLRNRAAPVREDVADAIVSCFIKGDADADGTLVRAAARKVFCGTAMGKIPAGLGAPPLVRDFEFRARKQRLKIDESERRRLALDIYRRPEHRVTSRLLHGLALLGVPFAVRSAGPDFVRGVGLDRLQEQWEYGYTPLTEATLVEMSMYGTTVPLAVANRFTEQLDRAHAEGARDARAATAALTQACVLGLHDHLPRVLALLRQAIAEDAAFAAVAAATASVGLLWESREPLEARELGELQEVLQSAYERAVFLGAESQVPTAEEDAQVEALIRLRELLRSAAGRELDAELYWGMAAALYRASDSPMVRGAVAGLLYSSGRFSEDDMAQALHGHFHGMLPPHEAASFLRGLLHTAREAAWQQETILNILDQMLAQWGEDDFVANLPELRLAFSAMTPRETDRIAVSVAGLHGEDDLGNLVRHDLHAGQLQANLLLSQSVTQTMLQDGLAAWGLA